MVIWTVRRICKSWLEQARERTFWEISSSFWITSPYVIGRSVSSLSETDDWYLNVAKVILPDQWRHKIRQLRCGRLDKQHTYAAGSSGFMLDSIRDFNNWFVSRRRAEGEIARAPRRRLVMFENYVRITSYNNEYLRERKCNREYLPSLSHLLLTIGAFVLIKVWAELVGLKT